MKKVLSFVMIFALAISACILLSSCGEDGKNGEDGKTPYIGENGNWWIGEEDTGVKAEGEKGDTGVQGDKGDKGDVGAQGSSGNTPYVGTNGNWWIGTTDTGIKAQGDKGDKGDAGDVGAQGDKGDTGAQGPQGDKGDKGDTGAPGENGTDGLTPYIGTNGNWWIGTTDTGIKAQGDKGDKGDTGAQGPQGEKGDKGDTGDKGDKGDTGAPGENGTDGLTPYIGTNGNWWIGTTDTGIKAEGGSSTPDDTEDPENDLADVTVIKTSSHEKLRTVHPGDEIVYTFTVENKSSAAKNINIADVIPENTAFKSGDCSVSGRNLSFSVSVPANSKATATYTVTVTADTEKIGTAIVSDSATVDGKAIDCADVYIDWTFNEYDMQKLVIALYAMRESEFDGKDLLTAHYRIAFSINCAVAEEADAVAKALFVDASLENSGKYAEMVVPGLYGGKASASIASRVIGDATDTFTIEDIFPGDILVVLPSASDISGARMYITDGSKLFDVTGKTTEVSASSVLDTIADNDYFALLRAATASETSYRSEPFYEGETDVERAIIAAANAFILRGDRMQYGDSYLATGVSRWERDKTPEDYTIGEIGYSNCTGFTHDLYYTALGWDYGSFALYSAPDKMIAYRYTLTHSETDAEKAAIEAEYRSKLQVGDIIYYSYSGNNHGMVYLGNGNLMHCTGSVYNTSTSNYYDVQEASIRFQNLDTLFTPGNGRYFFQTEKPRTNIYIIRPLNSWTGSIPEESVNRVENMKGIVAEKLASHTLGQTVNPGGLITYTFKIFNTNKYSVTLDITDIIPEGTTLIVDGVASAERTLSWSVEIAPGSEKLVSYTVKVSESAEYGSAIFGSDESKVGGVPVRITPIFVGRTLTEAEQELVVETARSMAGGSIKNAALANKIYKEALGIDNILGATTTSALRNGLFVTSGDRKAIASEGYFAQLIAPTLYGGRNVANSDRFLGERTRMLWERNLIVGDILLLQGSSDTSVYIYMYIGNGKLFDLQKVNERGSFERLEDALGWKEFAIIRPSLAITD